MTTPLAPNLIPGQMMIEGMIVGRGTNCKMPMPEFEADEVVKADYQISRTSEVRFGVDSLAPGNITFNFNVLRNFIRPNAFNPTNLTNDIFSRDVTIEKLRSAWRFDRGRNIPGEMMPLYICGEDGETRLIFGRPDKFQGERAPHEQWAGWLNATADFRRADTLNYSAEEYAVPVMMQATPWWLTRVKGDVDSWLRIIIEGPATNPVITVGEQQISMDYEIDADEVVEISSYPWQRRVVNNRRENLSPLLNSTNNYLDKLVIPANATIPIRWTSDEYGTFVPALGNISWAFDIQDVNRMSYWDIPDTFTKKAGKLVVRLDLFNPKGPLRFISSGLFGAGAAALFTAKQFTTSAQHFQARIVEPQFQGHSGLVIMSNDAMTNFPILEIVSHPGVASQMRIRVGTGPLTFGAPVGTTYSLGRDWRETDIPAFEYDPVSNRFIGLLNGVERLYWEDTGNVINKANRKAGLVCDMFSDMLSIGPGFTDFVGYDKATVPAPTGKVTLLWRDAYGMVK